MQKAFWLKICFFRWKGSKGPWQRSVSVYDTYDDANNKYESEYIEFTPLKIQGPFYVTTPEPDPVKSNRRARPSRKDGTGRRQRGRSGEPDSAGSKAKPGRSKRASPRR